MLTFVMDGPLVLERITHFQFGTMMPSGAVHPIIYERNVTYAKSVIASEAKQSSAEAPHWIASSLCSSQ